jgi:predicted DNA-binding transcriptional regulator YafY
MSKYERLITEINLLKARKNLNASDLSRELRVSKRTIYRDMLSLAKAQVPVYFDKGYKLLSDTFFPTLNFNLEEYLVIKMGLRSSPIEQIPYLSKLARSAMSKIESNLTTNLRSQQKKTDEVLCIDPKLREKGITSSDFFGIIENSILNQRAIKVQYQTKKSSRYICEVEPYSLVFRCGGWILCGFCLSHQEYHLFDLSYLKNIMILDREFERDQNYSLSRILEKICKTCLSPGGGCGTFKEQMKTTLPEKILR